MGWFYLYLVCQGHLCIWIWSYTVTFSFHIQEECRCLSIHHGHSSLHLGHSISFWSLTNINLVWTVIFHLLQMFYPWHCFLYAHKAMWWVLWVPFHGSFPFVVLPERIGFIVLHCYCRCHNILESALCWVKKKKASG